MCPPELVRLAELVILTALVPALSVMPPCPETNPTMMIPAVPVACTVPLLLDRELPA